jgi:cellulose synthase/poly-beta-1,6-N-acetylglucosamine synthase-like glycosyltransferase
MTSLFAFVLVWGVWLITPVLFDGIDALVRFLTVVRHPKDAEAGDVSDADLPTVCVIVPAHNEVEVIDRCLNSIKAQDYPGHLLEVVVVDDGSTDGTSDRLEDHVNGTHQPAGDIRLRGERIRLGDYHGTIAHIRQPKRGKSAALNTGIAYSDSEIVVNIDSDVVLAPDTIRAIASKFVLEPDLGAVTGNVEIDWDLIEARDPDGNVLVDDEGCVLPRRLTGSERLLAVFQFLEYLSSFSLGRRAQAATDTMYTLAGACSAFRREALQACGGYSSLTVSEDTFLTFRLHHNDVRVGFVKDARVYIEPVTSWDTLYSQRVRWTRGQLEVCGYHRGVTDEDGRGHTGLFSRMIVPTTLLFDHTLAFPRLIWAPLLLAFPLIGYSYRIIAMAMLMMYLFYLVIEIANTLYVHRTSDEHARERIESSGWPLVFMPIYRFIVFHFRFSGFLVTLTEEQTWSVPGPMDLTRRQLRGMGLRSIRVLSGVAGWLGGFTVRLARNVSLWLLPLITLLSMIVPRSLSDWWRRF